MFFLKKYIDWVQLWAKQPPALLGLNALQNKTHNVILPKMNCKLSWCNITLSLYHYRCGSLTTDIEAEQGLNTTLHLPKNILHNSVNSIKTEIYKCLSNIFKLWYQYCENVEFSTGKLHFWPLNQKFYWAEKIDLRFVMQ